MYATGVVTGGGGDVLSTNPLSFDNGTYRTQTSLASYITLANNELSHVAFGFGYTAVNNPALTPGASVADVQSGFADREGTRNGNMLNITFGSNVPVGGVRIGVIVNDSEDGDGVDDITLLRTPIPAQTQEAGSPYALPNQSYALRTPILTHQV